MFPVFFSFSAVVDFFSKKLSTFLKMEKMHLLTVFQTSVRFSEQFSCIQMKSLYYLVLHTSLRRLHALQLLLFI